MILKTLNKKLKPLHLKNRNCNNKDNMKEIT